MRHSGASDEAGTDLVSEDFSTLYERELPRLLRVIYAAAGSDIEAQDIAQETFVRAHARWVDLSSHPNIGGWLTITAMNLARSARRRQRVAHRLRWRSAPTSASGDTSDASALSAAFWGEVSLLPRRLAQIVVLHYLEDRPIAEIGELLGIADGTVKASLFDARKRLKIRLAAKGWLDE